MTDRIKGITVAFDRDIRADDVQDIIRSIRLFRFVSDVQPSVVGVDDHINRMRIRTELEVKLWDALREKKP